MTAEDQDRAERLLDDMSDRFLRGLVAEAKDRLGFARVAAAISQDRYGAGSTAARVAIYVMLVYGYQMAVDFMDDLGHHEQ